MSGSATSTAPRTRGMTVADLLLELEQESQGSRRLLERVPGDRLDWSPHEKSMTLGQLAMHIAGIPGRIAEISQADAFDIRTAIPRPGATDTRQIVQLLDESCGRARSILETMKDADLLNPWRMMKGEEVIFAITRGELLRTVMLNHWYHHRGQLTVYLRLLGVPVPAIYGDSADERAMG